MKSRPLWPMARKGIFFGLLGSTAALPAVVWQREAFFQAYLVVYLFWIGITLGSLVWGFIHPLTSGSWLTSAQRFFVAGRGTLWLMALLFLPILLGIRNIYPWADPARVASDPLLQMKGTYLNVPFFAFRQVVYFLGWLLIAHFLKKNRDNQVRLSRWSAGGFVFYGMSALFFSTDWIMSLSPHWDSTMFGLIVMADQALSAAVFVVFISIYLSRKKEPELALARETFQDFGSILLMLILLWAYLVFMQFLIIWSGNLPEEVIWYLPRTKGIWGMMILLIAALQFALPFLLLLFRDVKGRGARLEVIAAVLFVVNFLFINWTVLPSFSAISWQVLWVEAVLLLAIGGFWLALFFWNLEHSPPWPQEDSVLHRYPSTQALLSHEMREVPDVR